MASLISGYEYDIFISYRQKDNKGDRWVSEFVEALKTELEATFKEEISIYFDENSHDGLLETYDVDASLKEKLKCLIFIPIISRTYCDPKSFAWEHEFKAFVDQASADRFGLRTTLPNHNVTSRVLPVRIHELDIKDIKLCESILGGVIRSVDFVYKAAGVNRPLRAYEESPKDNLNKTYFRDQINKVANAVEEIIISLRGNEIGTGFKTGLQKDREPELKKEINLKEPEDKSMFSLRSKKGLIVLSMILLSVIVVFSVYKLMNLAIIDKTVAIIPLQNDYNDPALTENGDILMDAIREKLQRVKRITLIPRISCLQYRNTKKSINTIRKELNANYLIAGNVGLEANKTSIGIELIKTRANKQLWFQKYILDKSQIIKVSNEIVRNITSELNYVLSSEEKNRLEVSPTKNDEAYMNYITANGISGDNWFYYNMGNKLLDSTSFRSAVLTYEKALKNDSLFALAYAKRAIARSWGFYIGQFDSSQIDKCWKDINKALEIDKELTEAQNALGFYYYYCKSDCNNALKHFKIAADKDPENYQPLLYMAIVYRKMGEWTKSQSFMNRVIKLNPQEPLFLTNIGLSYEYLRNYDSALIYHQKAIDVMPVWSAPYKNKIETYILKNGDIGRARIVLDTGILNSGENFNEYRILLNLYEGKYKEALNLAKQSVPQDFEVHGDKYIYLAMISGYLENPQNPEKYYDSALVVLNHELVHNPVKTYLHSYIGVAFAGKGDKEKAFKEVQYASDLSSSNELDKLIVRLNLAQINVMLGDYDNAIRNIDTLLSTPSCFSTNLLQLDPFWKPLAKLPGFQSLIKKYSAN